MILNQESHLHVGLRLFRAKYAMNGAYAIVELYQVKNPPRPSTVSGCGKFVEVERLYIAYQGDICSSLSYSSNGWVKRQNNVIPAPIQFSIRDAGIDQVPKYNDHAMFDELAEAMKYIEDLAQGNINGRPSSGHSTPKGIQPQPKKEDTPEDAYDRAMRIV